MNKKAIFGGLAAVVLVVVAVVGYKAVSLRSQAAQWSGPMKEIVEEKITHDNNITMARFVSLIDAPLPAVERAVWEVENSDKLVENIKMSKLVETRGNTKIVEINLQSLNLPLLTYTMEFTHYPEQHRITFKTIKSQAQDIEGTYQLDASPDGSKTRLLYMSTAHDKIALPFPQSVLDSANRETYVNTVRGLQKAVKPPGGAT